MNARNPRVALLLAAGLGILFAQPFAIAAQAEEPKSLEALAAESASTPAQHQALAAYYRQKAAAAREEVKTHRTMALSYSSRSAGAAAGMRAHCDNLAKAAEQQATEYDALAALHDAEAKK